MGLPEVNSCCCGCSLRTGSCFIGLLCAIATLSSTISVSVYAQNLDPRDVNYPRDYSFAICQALLSAFMLLTNVLLVLGAMQYKASYVKPWVVLNSVTLAIQAGLYVAVFVLMLVYGTDIGTVLGSIAAFFIVFGIAYYFLAVVSSFYKSLLLPPNGVLHPQPPLRDPAYPYPPPYSLQRVQVVPVAVSPPPYPSAAPTATHVTVQGLVVVQEEPYASAPYAKY